jgi:hypothetical protein
MVAAKKLSRAQFERSRFDVEKKGEKEGSAADRARDKKQMTKANKGRK